MKTESSQSEETQKKSSHRKGRDWSEARATAIKALGIIASAFLAGAASAAGARTVNMVANSGRRGSHDAESGVVQLNRRVI